MEFPIYYEFPGNVLQEQEYAYDSPTVGDLYEMANMAIAGEYDLMYASLRDISEAVATINNAFDGCRQGIFIPEIPEDRSVEGIYENGAEETIEANAFPNPFYASTTIEFSSPVAAQATVEIYNLNGNKLSTLFEGYVEANRTYSVKFNSQNVMSSNTYIYLIKAGEQVKYGRLVIIK